MKMLLTCALFLPTIAEAQSMESMTLAKDLGSLLAAEDYCGLKYDPAAIQAFIDEKADPSDMGFASNLQAMTSAQEFSLEAQGEAAKVAHCHAIERSAKHFGFIK